MPRARRADPEVSSRIPAGLAGPIDLELTKAVEEIPGPKALAGGTMYQPKFDGYRVAIVRTGDAARLWSRNGTDLTESFPDIVQAAVRQLLEGVVLDGELVISVDGRLSFDTLQRRRFASPASARRMAASTPATYVAFDLLAIGGVDLRPMRWSVRRARLEALAHGWEPPLEPCPTTSDPDEARLWFEVLPDTMGTEGLVCKGAASRYIGGRRTDWWKVKRRNTVDVIIGGVIGPIDRPQYAICGRYRSGELVVFAHTTALTESQSLQLGAELTPADPDHPWPDEISSPWRGGSKRPLTKVSPDLVAEISADAATQAGRVRHAARFVRLCPDVDPDDVPTLPRDHQQDD